MTEDNSKDGAVESTAEDKEEEDLYVTAYDVHGSECGGSVCMSTGGGSVAMSVYEGTMAAVSHWKVMVFGQGISFLVACAAAGSATLHLECELSAPTAQTAGVYLLLSLHALWMWLQRCGLVRASVTRLAHETSLELSSQQQLREERHRLPQHSYDCDEEDEDEEGFAAVDGEIVHDEAEVYVDPALSNATAGSVLRKKETAAPYSLFGLSWLPLHAPWWAWLGIAFLDVEANYFTFLAMRYTTLTSTVLFSSLAIPSAMLCSKLFLHRHYKLVHIIGAATCLAGVLTNVFADYEESHHDDDYSPPSSADHDLSSEDDYGQPTQPDQYPRRVLGDFLAISGGLLLGINDVLAEIAIKTFGGGWNEYCAMLGLFGFLISTVQVLLIESKDIQKFFSSDEEYHQGVKEAAAAAFAASISPTDDFLGLDNNMDDNLYNNNNQENPNVYNASDPIACHPSSGMILLFTYVMANYLHYVGVSRFLIISEAALLNLSLLTADLWSAVFAVIAEHLQIHPLFYLALLLIMSGVFLYETGPSPILQTDQQQQQQTSKMFDSTLAFHSNIT
mmetsp:Transcript_30699/g.44642  ORF Transcript_30699/g.44642 Transcript_30699/m.44642 type:complete len:562 (+) Transcript_30699:91-1776(+)